MTRKADKPEVTGEQYAEAFTEAFLAEIEAKKEWTERPEEEWRASGKATKAKPNREDPTWWLTEGPKFVEVWAGWWDRMVEEYGFEIWTAPGGKPAIELDIDDISIGREAFRCYIDVVVRDADGDLVVIDWKTGSMAPKSPFQLGEYACAIEARHKVRPSHGAFYDARKGDIGELYDLSRFTTKRVEQSLMRARLIREKNLYVPNPSGLCGSCGVRQWCWVMGGKDADEVPEF